MRRRIHLDGEWNVRKGLQDIQQHARWDGQGPSVLGADLHFGGHCGFQIRSGHRQLPWRQFKQEMIEDGQRVAVAQDSTQRLELTEKLVARNDELHGWLIRN
jgi:hypothetical protein